MTICPAIGKETIKMAVSMPKLILRILKKETNMLKIL